MQSNEEPFNIWHYKPWWCQPWSIILTGVVLIGGSWVLLHRIWVTALIAIPILIWMGFFILLYPRAIAAYLKQEAASQNWSLGTDDQADQKAENP